MAYKSETLLKGLVSKHSFRNNPDPIHQICVTCGCRREKSYKNSTGKTIITYFDRYGNKLKELPTECKSLLELLEEQ